MTVTNGSFVCNSIDNVDGFGSAVRSEDDHVYAYCNTFGNSGDTDSFAHIDDPTGSEGNIAVDPEYVSFSGAGPLVWDLTSPSANR